MTEHTELLALILPPQGRLAVAAADSAGLLPGPGLVLALEHKAATGSQTVAGLLDRDRVQQLADVLQDWLEETETVQPATPPVMRQDGAVDVATDATVAAWLASGAEQLRLDDV